MSLFAAAMVLAGLNGAWQTEHRLAHAADWPPVTTAGSMIDADHDPLHVHVAPGSADRGDTGGADDRETGDSPSGGHHHSVFGDNPNAVPSNGHVVNATLSSNEVRRLPAGDRPRPEHDGDGPEYPPKQTRTVI